MNIVRTFGATIHFRDDKIIHIHYDDIFLAYEDSVRIFKFTREHAPWEVAPLYLTGGSFSNQDAESKKFNGSDEVMKHCSAVAFLSTTLGHKMLANFFIKIIRPSSPTQFFSKEEDAINWLKQFPVIPKS